MSHTNQAMEQSTSIVLSTQVGDVHKCNQVTASRLWPSEPWQCSLVGGYQHLRPYAASIFRVEVCKEKNRLGYLGRLLATWLLGSSQWTQEIEPGQDKSRR